jgi:hypothetical protein
MKVPDSDHFGCELHTPIAIGRRVRWRTGSF